jgi:hypothetical protein
MLPAMQRGVRSKPRKDARCVFATMLQRVFAIAESGIYRSRDCRNPSLIAPSMDAQRASDGVPSLRVERRG